MALGSLPVTIKASNGATLATGTAVNGTTRITLPDYEPSATAVVGGNSFYYSSQNQNSVQYDLQGMIQTQGPAGSDPVTNAKYTIIRDYVQTSGAFTYNIVTDNYTWNGNDKWNGLLGCYKWTDSIPFYGSVDRGYCVINAPQIAKSELNSSAFDNQKFDVRQYWGAGVPPSQFSQDWFLSKMDFFTFWLGQKLEPTSWGGNPHDPSGYTQFNALAGNMATFLGKSQSFFQNDPNAQSFSAQVRGLLQKATQLGFPQPQGALEQLVDFINGVISAFIGLVQAVWSTIVNFVGAAVNFVMMVWNNVIGPVLGAVIEAVKNVVIFTVKIVIQTITSFIQSLNPENTPVLTQEEFNFVVENKDIVTQLYTNGFTANSLSLGQEYNYLNTFNQQGDMFAGVSSIFSTIIDIAGPGIISFVLQEIASYLMTNVIMPIIITMSDFSVSDIVNSIFGTVDTGFQGGSVQSNLKSFSNFSILSATDSSASSNFDQKVESFISLFSFVTDPSDLIASIVNGIGTFTGSMIEGLLNWYVEVGYQIFVIPAEYMLPYSLIFGLINLFVQVVGNIFNIGPENVIPLKQIALAFADEIFDILKIKATDEVVKLHLEVNKFLINIESLGLSLYEVCKNLLGDGLNFPQKLLFSLLWMVKIINSFTGSFLSLAQDFFSVMGVIDVSELVQLEAYTILINMALEIALFLFFEVIFGNLNISNTIAMGQLGIIGMFFVLFLIESYRSYDIKKMEVNGTSETLINIKKAGNIKFSLILEFSQLLLKLYGALEF